MQVRISALSSENIPVALALALAGAFLLCMGGEAAGRRIILNGWSVRPLTNS